MRAATYEIMEDGLFYGEVAPCPGVWATGVTLEDCREELRGVLEGWVLLGLALRDSLPVIAGVDINVSTAAVA